MESISLSRLHGFIARVIKLNFEEPLWVSAEIVNVNLKSGHYYLELAEKTSDGQILAQATAILWRGKREEINLNSHVPVEQLFIVGHELKFLTTVSFHPRYGYKLTLEKVDTAYGLGQIALSRQKTIEKLKLNNLWQLNRLCTLSPAINNIALISSAGTAAYADFIESINKNPKGYTFNIKLFNVSVQGNLSVPTIMSAFKNIKTGNFLPDIIVLIRGGGSKHDLADFDTYEIASSISQSSIPVITGIGHQIDESVADLSAYQSLKTPTAAAEFILNHNYIFERMVESIVSDFVKFTRERIYLEGLTLNADLSRMMSEIQKKVHTFNSSLTMAEFDFNKVVFAFKESIKAELISIEHNLNSNDPQLILKKGYSLTLVGTENISQCSTIEKDQEINTRFNNGILYSKVSKKWQKNN